MSTLLDKIKISTGRDESNNFNLSCFHATTSTFYTPRVTYFHEFVPDEKWEMDARCSVRCLPMVKPTIADIKIHNRFFFIPYYSIMARWNEFLSESPTGYNENTFGIPQVPTCTEWDILNTFLEGGAESPSRYVTIHTGASTYDFARTVGSETKLYKFTKLGATINSILNGLGIVLNFRVALSDKGATINCLGILAYLKVYLDWYNNSAFDNKKYLEYLFDLGTRHELHITDLDNIFRAIGQLYLEKDYFTSATLYPVGSNASTMGGTHDIPDITLSSSTHVYSDPHNSIAHGTPFLTPNSNPTNVTKYSLDAVNALTDYVKRHQLAGIQPFNRILAEYGVTLDDEVLKRSTFIGDVVEDVDVKTVVNMSYAEDSAVGETAGLAGGGNSKNLSFHNKNFGCIICVSTIVPRLSYTDGIRKAHLRTQRFDFFTPSVEHLGVEPVAAIELYNRFDTDAVQKVPPTQIFGYLPRYAAYKTALDSVSGNFSLRSRRTSFMPWILRRVFPNMPLDLRDIASISEEFTRADDSKVSDMFVTETTDNFIIFNMYHCTARLPMHKLFDDYQWSNEGDNPQHVTIPNQGVQLT